ncbi:unnamed protein product, partial [Effrenium voratum]
PVLTCGMAWALWCASLLAAAQDTAVVPLDIRYPGLAGEMYGCMLRCYSGVMQEANADRKLCATVRCVRDCSRTTSRDCPAKALTACETLLNLIDVVKSQCYMDCSQ